MASSAPAWAPASPCSAQVSGSAGSAARQPENSARIQTAGLIFAALIEGVALFVAVIALLMQGKITF